MSTIFAKFCSILIILINFIFLVQCLVIRNSNDLQLLRLRLKKDVTVITTKSGDPCPTVVDSNRVVGAGLQFGPTLGGNFYGQGQHQNPLDGFKSWGGNLGANNLGFRRGFDLGIPIGSKVLDSRNSGCQQTSAGGQGVQPDFTSQQSNGASVQSIPSEVFPGQSNSNPGQFNNAPLQFMKRDVTVVQTSGGDPCPTVVDSNRVVGAGLHYGPSLGGNFYGQGQRQNPLNGFRSWGGNLGYNNLGYKGGWDLGIPIGSKVLNGANSGCQLTNNQQQFRSNPSFQQDSVGTRGSFQAGPGISSVPANQYPGNVLGNSRAFNNKNR